MFFFYSQNGFEFYSITVMRLVVIQECYTMHKMFLEIYMARGELCLPKNNISKTPNAIRPLYRNQFKSRPRTFLWGMEKIKRDVIWCHERLDLLFGKHTTVHKTQNLAESRSDVRSPRSRIWSELRGDLPKSGGLQQISRVFHLGR